MRTSYKKRLFKNFNEFLSDIPNNEDRALMQKELNKVIQKLIKHNIDKPFAFIDIMNRFNLSRPVITEFMKQLICIKIDDYDISKRILNHSNAFEKNTILTFYSLCSSNEMIKIFKEFVTEKFPHFKNKDDLFYLIIEQIKRVLEYESEDIQQLNCSPEIDIKDVVVDGFLNDYESYFINTDENNYEDEFITFVDYLYD